MIKVRKELNTIVKKNREREKANSFYTELLASTLNNVGDIGATKINTDHMEKIIDMR